MRKSGYGKVDESGSHFGTGDFQESERDRQREAPRASAPGVEIENAFAVFDFRFM